MDLLQWTPVVFKTNSRPGQTVPMLELRAWLRCLFCGSVTEAKSAPTHLNHVESPTPNGKKQLIAIGETGTYLDEPSSRYAAGLSQLKHARACEHCGFISIMPTAQAAKLDKDIARVITIDWIKAQTEAALPPEPQLREDIKALIEAAVKQALA